MQGCALSPLTVGVWGQVAVQRGCLRRGFFVFCTIVRPGAGYGFAVGAGMGFRGWLGGCRFQGGTGRCFPAHWRVLAVLGVGLGWFLWVWGDVGGS